MMIQPVNKRPPKQKFTTKGTRNSGVAPTGLWIGVLILLLMSLRPTLTRSHVEGFSYLTETMSLLLPDIASTDPLWGMIHNFFYLSRPGTIWLMAPLSDLAPGSGYDLLMWIILPIFMGGLVVLTKLWSKTTWLASVATLLFLPIVIDAQFFFNDNVVAASFAIWGLILLEWSRRLVWIFAAGTLLSIALLCRLDQILLLPLFLFLTVFGSRTFAIALQRSAAFLSGAIMIHLLMALVDPQAANVMFRIEVASAADTLWDRGNVNLATKFYRDLSAALLAFGVGLPAIFFGFKIMESRRRLAKPDGWRSRTHTLPLILMVYPALIYGITLGKYYDPRAFMTLIPFLATATALSLDQFVLMPLVRYGNEFSSKTEKLSTRTIVILGAFLVPGAPMLSSFYPVPYESENAIPTLTGRIWFSDKWMEWQNAFFKLENHTVALLYAIEDADTTAAVISYNWTEERALQNALVIAGYRILPPELAACSEYATYWRHPNGAELYHIRSHIPFLPDSTTNSAAIFLEGGQACLNEMRPEARFALVPITSPLPKTDLVENVNQTYRLSDAEISALAHTSRKILLQGNVTGDSDPEIEAKKILEAADAALNAQ
ncbi:hypothetical protein [Roseovarius sp. EL26]|uniref:hypothetical protein n=1 Tax=Roseovarius sp. EL26 TaxID=2126672 RepID=UPI000EA08830|nr:hypothetical protein [Roseovarius sp. EL26]